MLRKFIVRGWSYFENSNEKVTVRLLSGNRMVTFEPKLGQRSCRGLLSEFGAAIVEKICEFAITREALVRQEEGFPATQ